MMGVAKSAHECDDLFPIAHSIKARAYAFVLCSLYVFLTAALEKNQAQEEFFMYKLLYVLKKVIILTNLIFFYLFVHYSNHCVLYLCT